MPQVNGFSLLKRVRSCPRYRHLPVIVCSGNNDRETILQSGQLAANYYIVKPFKLENLLSKIQELGQRRRPVASSRHASTASASPIPGTPTASS